MKIYSVERLSESGDRFEIVGKYKQGGDFFAVKCGAVILDTGERYYLLNSWIFNTLLPTMPDLKSICIIDSISDERHIIKLSDLDKYKIGEEGEFFKICPLPKQDKKQESPSGVPGAFDFLE